MGKDTENRWAWCVFSLHVVFDISHVFGMKECWFRPQQLSVLQAVPCVTNTCFCFRSFQLDHSCFPSPSFRRGKGQIESRFPITEGGLKSLSLLVHRDSFQILERVIGRASAGANQRTTVASQWPSARLCQLKGWLRSPSDFLYLISPYSHVWKRV